MIIWKVSRSRWLKSNLDRNLSFVASRERSDSFQAAGTTREGDLETENFETPFVTLMVSKSAPWTKINFIAIWLRVEQIFPSSQRSAYLETSSLFSRQSLNNKRIRGTDDQNQFNSFAGSYRQNTVSRSSSNAAIH